MIKAFPRGESPSDGKMTPCTKQIVQQQLDIAEDIHLQEIRFLKEEHQKEIARMKLDLEDKFKMSEGWEVVRDLMMRLKEADMDKREVTVQYKEKESRLKKEKHEIEDERNRLIQELEGLWVKVQN